MSPQGTLNLDCIAADSKSTVLYGIANARGIDLEDYTVLVKSNTHPSSLTDLTWTVVSKVKITETAFRFPAVNSVDCAVSSAGEFSAFFYSPTHAVAGPAAIPMGVRYDSEKAAWGDIKGSLNYGWTESNLMHRSFYIRNGGGGGEAEGKESVVHLLTDEFVSQIRFGTVDEVTNTLQLAGIWKMTKEGTYEKSTTLGDPFERSMHKLQPGIIPSLGYTFAQRVAYGDGHLYITGRGNKYPTTSTLTVYPFTRATDDPDPSIASASPGPANYTFKHAFFGVRGNSTTYLAGLGYQQFDSPQKYHAFYTQMIDDPSRANKTFGPGLPKKGANMYAYTHYPLSSFQAVGGHLPGQDPFGVIPMTDGLYWIPLSGSNGGNLTGPVQVVIPDEGINTWPRKINDSYRNMDDESSPNFRGAPLLATIVGVMVVVVVVLGLVMHRRSKQMKKDRPAVPDEEA